MTDKIVKSEDEWRTELSDEVFEITRKGGSERAFSHDNFSDAKGVYNCVCCGNAVFDSEGKFDAGTGWPSFFQPISASAVVELDDNSFIIPRTDVKCAICDAHLGNVTDDGPDPTGMRYTINGLALEFQAG